MSLIQQDRALSTDLYELTMAAAYFGAEMTDRAAFELFVRDLPPHRGYLLSAGLEQVLSYLQGLSFSGEQIDYLRELSVFGRIADEFFDCLAGLRFTGDLFAVAEGTPIFAEEPMLRVEAPIIEAQIVETFLLSMINFQTLIATKAARVVEAARSDGKERAVVDFGTRRAHGPDAAVLAARAAFVGGCKATSNVEAGFQMGIPVSGTEAHSFIMAFESELEAFQQYYRHFGDHAVLLIDTYDVLKGARNAIRAGPGMRGVRIDSGDIAGLSKKVRRMLDEAGLEDALILASGDLDEYAVSDLVQGGAAVDGFGVGTKLVTGGDAAFLGGVYKLVAVEKEGAWQPRLKLSEEKVTYPGRKQVHRFADGASGLLSRDVIATAEEPCPPEATPLLEPVLRGGQPLGPTPSLQQVRERAAEGLSRLPPARRRLRDPEPHPVNISEALREAFEALSEKARKEAQ
ncbi:MAG: nicotinate phosphoribosyltransferase [Planctomycetota bacterium]